MLWYKIPINTKTKKARKSRVATKEMCMEKMKCIRRVCLVVKSTNPGANPGIFGTGSATDKSTNATSNHNK